MKRLMLALWLIWVCVVFVLALPLAVAAAVFAAAAHLCGFGFRWAMYALAGIE